MLVKTNAEITEFDVQMAHLAMTHQAPMGKRKRKIKGNPILILIFCCRRFSNRVWETKDSGGGNCCKGRGS
jgi:hypothetical protein